LLKRGQPVVIFPEGRCSPSGELEPLSPGVSMVALRAGVPIIPVGLAGTNKVLPYGQVVPRPTLSPVRVHFEAPVRVNDLENCSPREAREVLTARLTQHLQEAVAQSRTS